MKEKDIEDIKFDLGLCTDTLISLFLGLFINEIFGIFYFTISIFVDTFVFVMKKYK